MGRRVTNAFAGISIGSILTKQAAAAPSASPTAAPTASPTVITLAPAAATQ